MGPSDFTVGQVTSMSGKPGHVICVWSGVAGPSFILSLQLEELSYILGHSGVGAEPWMVIRAFSRLWIDLMHNCSLVGLTNSSVDLTVQSWVGLERLKERLCLKDGYVELRLPSFATAMVSVISLNLSGKSYAPFLVFFFSFNSSLFEVLFGPNWSP